MPLVARWTGLEIKALREAKRMSIERFAEKLGVSDRIVSRWEGRGRDGIPSMVSQAALDTMLATADKDESGRFVGLLTPEATLPHQLVEPDEIVLSGHYARHPRDGKLMARIPAGIYLAGENREPQWLDEYWIDTYPVTNADYARYTAETGAPTPEHWGPKGRCPSSLYDHPVTEVSWKDATAYAEWANKRLPTSEEWEKAARGSKGAIYPWGDRATVAKCNVRETGLDGTTPVTKYHSGVSPYGVYDMVGNVWEWCSTQVEPGRHVLKGAAFSSPLFRGVPAADNDADEFMADDDTGFRCVADSCGDEAPAANTTP